MKISYEWLKTYFVDEIPSKEDIPDILNFHSFEVESWEDRGGDAVYDIKVLPNRAHDCLCHFGIAKEISAINNLKLKSSEESFSGGEDNFGLSIKVESALCSRYLGCILKGVKVYESPEWLRARLGSIGQKSINNLVDLANFAMFSFGQPLHVFDLDKLDGNEIFVRVAREGEEMTTLDGKQIQLKAGRLVISDKSSILAVAGIKGGKKAEVDSNTKNIIIESANFDATSVRLGSREVQLRTEASIRFEHNVAPELASSGLRELVHLIAKEGSSNIKIGKAVDYYPSPLSPFIAGISERAVTKLLGVKINEREISEILKRLGFGVRGSSPLNEILSDGLNLVGVPYKFGASIRRDAPEFFDCSSLTAYLFSRVGIAIPRMSVDQYFFGEEVDEKDIQAGDLVFAKNGDENVHYESKEFLRGKKMEGGISHVGLYLGGRKVLHARGNDKNGQVTVEDLDKSEGFKNRRGVRRIPDLDRNRLVVEVPPERLDIRSEADLVEEVGRIYGLTKIVPSKISSDFRPAQNDELFCSAESTRQQLISLGYSEIINYIFSEDGEAELKNPLDSGKRFFRTNLKDGLARAFILNERNKDLLGLPELKIFEIGDVFVGGEEKTRCAVGNINKKVDLSSLFSFQFKNLYKGELNIVEFDLPEFSESCDFKKGDSSKEVEYHPFSPYPFIVRDIAVFVPVGVSADLVSSKITEKAGEYFKHLRLFDEFTKEEKVSYAFRLVFQSDGRTLTNEEINKVLEKITVLLNSQDGWQVR